MNALRGKNVLIAGGSGLIGTRLAELFNEKGYTVKILGRQRNGGGAPDFLWDPAAEKIDPKAIPWADFIINLAGYPIVGGRWTKAAKKKILGSRTMAVNLLYRTLCEQPNHVRAYIGASAIGIYGDRGRELLSEDSIPATDFLAGICSQWEAASSLIKKRGIRTVILRIGIVLSTRGAALKEMLKPFRFFAAPHFNDGRQIYSWIHIDDLCGIILWAVENNNASGTFNAVAPVPVSNKEMIRAISMVKGNTFLSFSLPPSLLKIIIGEASVVLLDSQLVTSKKIVDAGYHFRFPEIKGALKALLS